MAFPYSVISPIQVVHGTCCFIQMSAEQVRMLDEVFASLTEDGWMLPAWLGNLHLSVDGGLNGRN